jgi:glyoxylase-like metal-dependent hydrolase (beta-lactamase superfamily II)
MAHIQIVAVHHSPFNTAKSYLLLGDRVVIVDTGPPDRQRRGVLVRRALADAGRSSEDVSLILATHAHPDHVGNAVALRDWTGAPIAADNELACFEGKERLGVTPTGPGVWRSVAKLLQLGNLETVHVCHGGPLLPRDVRAWVTQMSSLLHRPQELA